jgi:hypothetical protein
MMWNEAGKLRPGDWYCIEGEVDLNTPGLADGALRAWVDGTPAFDAAGIEFRRPDEPQIRIESFWFNVYYGGKPTAEKDMGLTIDEVAVDTTRIGCGGEENLERTMRGDLTGNGFEDRLAWATVRAAVASGSSRPAWPGGGRPSGWGAEPGSPSTLFAPAPPSATSTATDATTSSTGAAASSRPPAGGSTARAGRSSALAPIGATGPGSPRTPTASSPATGTATAATTSPTGEPAATTPIPAGGPI